MPYYHVYIKWKDTDNKLVEHLQGGFKEANLKSAIVNPIKNNRAFLFAGKTVYPSDVKEIRIYKSKKSPKNLVLPNGTPFLASSLSEKKIIRAFDRGKIGDGVVTHHYLIEIPRKEITTKTPTKPLDKKKKIFIVHGRDDKQALLLQKYLTRTLKKDAVMFDDLPDKGKTIIEQLEHIRDNVGYAFVVATPDDVGCLVEDIEQLAITLTRGKRSLKVKEMYEILDTLLTRPRQNVIFELGLFIGALGRDKVCYLLQKDVKDKPSDLQGILYKSFDKTVKEVFQEIADELKEG